MLKTIKLIFKNNIELTLTLDENEYRVLYLKENHNFWFQFDQVKKINIPNIVFRKYLNKNLRYEEMLKSNEDNLKLLFLLKKFKLNPKNEIKFNLDILCQNENEIFWNYLIFRTKEENENNYKKIMKRIKLTRANFSSVNVPVLKSII